MADNEKPQRQDILDLIKSLTGQTNILTIPRAFIDYTRSLDAALLLSQIIYWTDRADPDGWFYKSYSDWEYETTLGEYEVRKAINLFKTNGLLITKIQKVNGNPTLHYKFYMDRFSDSFLQFLKERKPIFSRNESAESKGTKAEKLKEPIKEEITTEITAKITTEKLGADALPQIAGDSFTVQATKEEPPAVSHRKQNRTAKTGKTKSPPDPRSSHVAIQAVRDLIGYYPAKLAYDDIIEVLGEKFDPDKLKECAVAWSKVTKNMGNLTWIFEWYVSGIPNRNGGNGNGQKRIVGSAAPIAGKYDHLNGSLSH